LRHVYSGDVVKAIVDLLGDQRTYGEAYNLAQYAAPALVDLVNILAGLLGMTGAPPMVSVSRRRIADASVDADASLAVL